VSTKKQAKKNLEPASFGVERDMFVGGPQSRDEGEDCPQSKSQRKAHKMKGRRRREGRKSQFSALLYLGGRATAERGKNLDSGGKNGPPLDFFEEQQVSDELK